MKTLSTSFAFAAFFFCIFTGISEAYTTTGQFAYSPNGHMGIYMTEFTFGHGDHDVYIPVLALRDQTIREDALSYTVTDEDGGIAEGTIAGIVASRATYKNGFYVVPRGTRETFTLLTIFTPKSETSANYQTAVTHLPFNFDGSQSLKLNPSELQYYVTPLLELK